MFEISEVLEIVNKHLIDTDALVLEKDLGKQSSPVDIVRKAFNTHFKEDQEPFEGFEDIGLIINDIDRPTPSSLVIDELLSRYEDLEEKITAVHIATGSHRSMTGEESAGILGRSASVLLGKVHVHDADDDGSHSEYGSTSRGTPVLIDSALEKHDLLMIINSVEPHYFAGYTGGRKSIMPGMAHYRSIEKNHSFALEEGSAVLKLQGNPVHEDLMEAVSMFMKGRDHISFQMVQGPGTVLTGLNIGDLEKSFLDAVGSSSDMFTMDVEGKYDIIITRAAPPMDRTLYQAQKALENARHALKDDGVIILLASCCEGIGNPTFWELLLSSPDPYEVISRIQSGYQLGYHKAARLITLASRAHILMVSEMDPDELKMGHITGYRHISEALVRALDHTGKDPSILIIPDGTVTVPNVVE